MTQSIYYLFFFRMSILKSQTHLTSSKINYIDSQQISISWYKYERILTKQRKQEIHA